MDQTKQTLTFSNRSVTVDYTEWHEFLTFEPIFNDNDLLKIAGFTVGNVDKNGKAVAFLTSSKKCTIRLTYANTRIKDNLLGNIQYRINSAKGTGTWTDYKFDNKWLNIPKGSSIQWRNKSNTLSIDTTNNYVRFQIQDGYFSAHGNIQSLLNFRSNVPAYAFYRLFYGCQRLCSGPKLLSPELGKYCYKEMFRGCTKLVLPPKISEEILDLSNAPYCCQLMFHGCSSLFEAPFLTATTLGKGCYREMFRNCIFLQFPMEYLPATVLAAECYMGMFQNCQGITVMPKITKSEEENTLGLINFLPPYCFKSMFDGCKNMTKGWQFLTVNSKLSTECCCNMFHNCKKLSEGNFKNIYCMGYSLQSNDHSAHGNCFKEMFQGCKALKEIHYFIRGFFSTNGGRNAYTCNWLEATEYKGAVDNLEKMYEKDVKNEGGRKFYIDVPDDEHRNNDNWSKWLDKNTSNQKIICRNGSRSSC